SGFGPPPSGDVYGESEWRYVPENAIPKRVYKQPRSSPSRDADFDLEIASANAYTDAHCRLGFELSDVRYVFVPTEADIAPMVNFVENSPAITARPRAEVQVLVTRIKAINTLLLDY
ncbi:MAG: hypothetical protein ACJ8GO_00370, partial [Ramlibacter sp.]